MLTATRGSYVLVVQQDDSPFNPREDDNFGKMVCFHRQYSLGSIPVRMTILGKWSAFTGSIAWATIIIT